MFTNNVIMTCISNLTPFFFKRIRATTGYGPVVPTGVLTTDYCLLTGLWRCHGSLSSSLAPLQRQFPLQPVLMNWCRITDDKRWAKWVFYTQVNIAAG